MAKHEWKVSLCLWGKIETERLSEAEFIKKLKKMFKSLEKEGFDIPFYGRRHPNGSTRLGMKKKPGETKKNFERRAKFHSTLLSSWPYGEP